MRLRFPFKYPISNTTQSGKTYASVTANDGYTDLPWHTIEVAGDTKELSLSLQQGGIRIQSDGQQSDLTVYGTDGTQTKEQKISTDKTDLFLTEKDQDFLITSDSDADGIYEEVIYQPSGNQDPQNYTISFNANGGTVELATMTTGTDGKLASLPTPTRTDYTFDGWYTSAIGGERVDENHVYTADTTLYAHWTETEPDDGKLHGRITISATFAEDDSSGTAYTIGGETVTLRAYPDVGYRLSSIQVIGPNGQKVRLTQKGDTYTFAMPTFDVTVCPEFTKI